MLFCSPACPTRRFESSARSHGVRAHDLTEPPREGRWRAQVLQAVERDEEGFLDGILGQMTIAEHVDSEIHRVVAESTNQCGGGGLIAFDASGQEFFKKLRHLTSAARP